MYARKEIHKKRPFFLQAVDCHFCCYCHYTEQLPTKRCANMVVSDKRRRKHKVKLQSLFFLLKHFISLWIIAVAFSVVLAFCSLGITTFAYQCTGNSECRFVCYSFWSKKFTCHTMSKVNDFEFIDCSLPIYRYFARIH